MAIDINYYLGSRMREFLRKQQFDPLDDVLAWNDQVERRQRDYRALVVGPADSPYAGGLFTCHFFIEGYAPRSSRIVFLTAILHPNVDSKGRLQTELLKDRSMNYGTALESVRTALIEPVVDGACNAELAALYVRDRERYISVVKEATRQFAY